MELLRFSKWLQSGTECVCRQMGIHALLHTDVAAVWAPTGTCDLVADRMDYWPKWVNPVCPMWLHRPQPRQPCICQQETVSYLWGGAEIPAAASSPFLRTVPCTEHCMTKPSSSTGGLPRTAHFFPWRKRALKAASWYLLRFRGICTSNRQVMRSWPF